jgi:gamma-glutamyltranspeptidase/glutathione hydrolase
MLSSQTPTIVRKNGKTILVTGSPGGRTIINTVLSVVTNVVDFEMDVQAAVDAPRQHHQWFPDELAIESNDAELIKKLEALGHKVKTQKQGDAHSIWIDPKTGLLHGAADKRIYGKAAGY